MWRALYSALLYALLPFALVRVWWRGAREPGYRRNVAERLGRYSGAPGKPAIWVHAVSVGEARASAPLARSLAAAHPDCDLLLTCTTAAGRATLEEIHGEAARIAWLPYDTPGAVRRFLARFRPRLGVLVETEVWPGLLAACAAAGVPVMLANARMSEQSARGYARLDGLTRPAFAALAGVCAQSETDAARLRELGARAVEVTGNLKFDASPDEARRAAGSAWRAALARPVLLFASTREGEEAMLLEALPPWDGKLLVVVVPRHPRRFKELALLARARRSRGEPPGPEDRVFLGDTLGEMDFYYAASDVAVIGGSFLPRGGQNLIEACAAGTPVVVGPSMFNFAEATQLALEAGAALQANDAADAVKQALGVISDRERRSAMGAAGIRLCAAHRGATARQLAACERLLERGGPRP